VTGGRPEGFDSDGPAEEGPARPVKLIVWDLDETLWEGTLSEGPVSVEQSRIHLVRTLNRRGIINSICSKNDAADARARLVRAGIWDEFVFARIDWSPKGPRVAQIVEGVQLRAEDVLFIDDLPLNRAEVRHAVPGIRTAGPAIIDRLLSLPELTGKDDRDLSRLQQYRILEKKFVDRAAVPDTSDAFLRSCDIRIGVFTDVDPVAERLLELVLRTNQLNFTKRRPDPEQFMAMLGDPGVECGYVRVRDRYGDYGICGFYSRSVADDSLTDFLFSCRVLNMGVEQWVYEFLGRPSVTVVGEVASSFEGPADWITMANDQFDVEPREGPAGLGDVPSVPAQPDKALMVGGCDLTTVAQFLGGDIVGEFSHTGPTGAFVYVGHTETLRQSAVGVSEQQGATIDRIPFLDRSVFSSPAVVSPEYDVLVYSVLTDYTQGLYRHRELDFIVPWHQFNMDVTDPHNWPALETRYGREGMDRGFLQWFSGEFEYLGGVSVSRFQENIRWLAASMPSGARLVLLNGAEVPIVNSKEPGRHLHHQMMNVALEEAVAGVANASICDVRDFVHAEDDLMSDIRHYKRHVYLAIADEIRSGGASELTLRREGVLSRGYLQARRFAGRRKVQLRRLSRRRGRVPSDRIR